jgi:hypothetical protein
MYQLKKLVKQQVLIELQLVNVLPEIEKQQVALFGAFNVYIQKKPVQWAGLND